MHILRRRIRDINWKTIAVPKRMPSAHKCTIVRKCTTNWMETMATQQSHSLLNPQHVQSLPMTLRHARATIWAVIPVNSMQIIYVFRRQLSTVNRRQCWMRTWTCTLHHNRICRLILPNLFHRSTILLHELQRHVKRYKHRIYPWIFKKPCRIY